MTRLVAQALRKLKALRLVDGRKLHQQLERTHLRRLLALLEVDCVFDVGANRGQYASMLRSASGFKGTIISFEPIPEFAAEIRRRSARDGAWAVEEIALAGETGEREFHVMRDSEYSSLGRPLHAEVNLFRQSNCPARTISVRTETLSAAYQRLRAQFQFRRPFLKMDTQGFDVDVVAGGKDVIRQFVGLQSELAIKRIYDTSVDFRDALTLYESLGFELSSFIPNNAGHFPTLIEIDCVMVRKDILQPYYHAASVGSALPGREPAALRAAR